jgi:hypothetical protein
MAGKTLLEILITICISILLIYGAQYIWTIIVNTYSKKKTKNLVDSQLQKYKKIIDEIQQDQGSRPNEFISDEEKKNMDEQLTEFLLHI